MASTTASLDRASSPRFSGGTMDVAWTAAATRIAAAPTARVLRTDAHRLLPTSIIGAEVPEARNMMWITFRPGTCSLRPRRGAAEAA